MNDGDESVLGDHHSVARPEPPSIGRAMTYYCDQRTRGAVKRLKRSSWIGLDIVARSRQTSISIETATSGVYHAGSHVVSALHAGRASHIAEKFRYRVRSRIPHRSTSSVALLSRLFQNFSCCCLKGLCRSVL